jgi:putative colanic acid biosynthesis UDP-glucose lipid carrier transferase
MSALLRVAFLLGDLFFLNASIFYSFRHFNSSFSESARINCIYLFIFSNLTWFFLFLVSDPYIFSKSDGVYKIFRRQLSFLFVHLLVVASLIFFFRKNYELRQIIMMYIFFVPAFFLWKLLIAYFFDYFVRHNVLTKNIIIIGHGVRGQEARKYLRIGSSLHLRFLKLFDPVPGRFPLADIQQFCEAREIHEIYCCVPGIGPSDFRDLVDFGMNAMIKIKLLSDSLSSEQSSVVLEQQDPSSVVDIVAIPLDDETNLLAKGLFDFIFSLFVIVAILSWLTPVLALAIKINSPGPVFFRQRRSGKDNKTFNCLKFRTMTVNSESDTQQATQNDERITRVGHFLRRTSLDELPQFFNVLQGTMSTVGPRPHMLKHTELYSKMLRKFMGRHYVKPGITGLAQERGYRGEIRNIADMKNRVKLDRFYIEHWSFMLDLRIIVQTALLVVHQKM